MRDRAKDPERHAKRMAAKQKIMQERIANAQNEQGQFGVQDHYIFISRLGVSSSVSRCTRGKMSRAVTA